MVIEEQHKGYSSLAAAVTSLVILDVGPGMIKVVARFFNSDRSWATPEKFAEMAVETGRQVRFTLACALALRIVEAGPGNSDYSKPWDFAYLHALGNDFVMFLKDVLSALLATDRAE